MKKEEKHVISMNAKNNTYYIHNFLLGIERERNSVAKQALSLALLKCL